MNSKDGVDFALLFTLRESRRTSDPALSGDRGRQLQLLPLRLDSEALRLLQRCGQLVSVGDAVSLQTLQSQNFRLKTFFHGWVADEAIAEGRVDLIPSRFVKIPQLIPG